MTYVLVKTFGCTFNKSDSQILKQYLKKENFRITNDENIAKLVVINSCCVKNLSEVKCFREVEKCKKKKQKIIVAGCIPQSEIDFKTSKLSKLSKLKDISVIGTNNLEDITKVAKQTMEGKIVQIIKKTPKTNRIKCKKFKSDKDELIEIVPINEGCLNNCSFCRTKLARGNLKSYSISDIANSIKKALKNGATEIYLTSQDVFCYGFDINTNLCELLEEITKLKGDFKIRIGMGNPQHLKKILPNLIKLIKTDTRIYKFLHIPIQSGNDRILSEMLRKHKIEDYIKIVETLKKQIPKITLATDVIVGFPTETDYEFKDTIKLVEKTKPEVLNFSRFWLRNETLAQKKYKQCNLVDGLISKSRSEILAKTFKKQAEKNNKKWIDWQGEVKVIEKVKNRTEVFKCRNQYYKPIIIKGDFKIGQIVNVKIVKTDWKLFNAEPIKLTKF